MGGGGSGQSASSSARSAAAAGTGASSVGINSKDLVWIVAAVAGALALIGIVWVITKD